MRRWSLRGRRSRWTITAVEPAASEPEPPKRAWNHPTWTPPIDDDPDPITTLKLMPDYGVELPLWGADWWQLGLSPRLLDDLADWQEQFNNDFRSETGWTNDQLAADWARRADELAAALRDELPATIPLAVNLWPIAEPRRRRWFNRRHR
jgi:hypothetical protein